MERELLAILRINDGIVQSCAPPALLQACTPTALLGSLRCF